MTITAVDLRLAGVDPEARFPGLPDSVAYDVAVIVDRPHNFTAHLYAAGCPAPHHPESQRSVLDQIECAIEDAGWPDPKPVFAAIEHIRNSLPRRPR